jgi:hypothetical protein
VEIFYLIARGFIKLLKLMDLLKYECESHLKQPLASPQPIIVVAYHTPNHRFVEEIN